MKTVDLEILVRPIPYTGLARHLGFIIPANGIQDNAAIACALRQVADTLDPKLSIECSDPAKLRAMCVGEFKGNDSVFNPLVPKPPKS